MKRSLDVLGVLLLLIPIGCGIAIAALSILVINRYRPFFFQARPGRNGVVFTCIKLNTLRPTKDESEINDKEKDKLRATKFGTWLRNRGIDELPQVWNILVGQMSFVGPRPLLEKNYAKISFENADMKREVLEWRKARERVLPGLSGWHQIHSLSSGIIRYDTEYLVNTNASKQAQVVAKSILILIIGKQRYFGVKI